MPSWSLAAGKWLALLAVVLAAEAGTCRAQSVPSDVVANQVRDRLAAWQRLVQDRPRGTWEKLVAVNGFFNQLTQQDDAVTWGADDYWATLDELLIVGAGDCEDFAGAKYTTLVAMGIPQGQLHLAITRAFSPRTRRIERHMVLIYDDAFTGIRWVLDNLSDRISSLSSRTDLALLRSIDARPRRRTALSASTAWVALSD